MDVQAPQVYTADSDSMSVEAATIEKAAAEARSEVSDLGPTELSPSGFGNGHTAYYADYSEGIGALAEGAEEMCSALSAFAARVSAVSQQYSQADEQARADVREAGNEL